MKNRKTIALVGFVIPAIAIGLMGVLYLFSNTIMPYHLTTMGVETWSDLTSGQQVMTLNFMKAASAGFITFSVASLFIAFIPLRRGEYWAKWALLFLALSEIGIVGYRTYLVATNGPANPPLIPSLVLLVLSVVSFFITPNLNKSEVNNQFV